MNGENANFAQKTHSESFSSGGRFAGKTIDDVAGELRSDSSKQRHEIVDDRIRARYGHSVPGRMVGTEVAPPERLFHGTSPTAWSLIAVEGLRPMGRQYVHLSFDEATAHQVGKRKTPAPVLLAVHAGEAHRAGIRFWRGNDAVWLTKQVPPRFLTQVS